MMPSDAQQMDNKQLRIPALATIQATATGIILSFYWNIFYIIT